MRWIKFSRRGRTAYGIVEGDRIIEVTGDPFDGYEKTARKHDLRAVKIEVPVIRAPFIAPGMNYTAHVKEYCRQARHRAQIPKKADIGYRANNALIAHDEPVIIPHDATEAVQYEGELVAVIGKKAKHLSESEALSCVLGYTIGNDVSERNWQKIGPHHVARQEHRHVQADGALDRDRCRSRRAGNHRPGERQETRRAFRPTTCCSASRTTSRR